MLSELSKYGAVATKVRAMYGAGITAEDYSRMAAMRSVGEVSAFIRSNTRWGEALEGADGPELHRDRLVYLLRRFYLREYLRLFHFLRREEHNVLRYPVLTAELEQVMRFMRLASAGRSAEYVFDLPQFFNKYSKIHYEKLSAAVTYGDMLEAVRDTDFYRPLRDLLPEAGGFPPYLAVETAMRTYTFRMTLEIADRKAPGRTAQLLREGAGIQADWFNITTIDRVLTYYPSMKPDILSYLLPFGAHLKPLTLRELYSAQDGEGLRRALERTYYGKFLKRREREPMEKSARRYALAFYRRHISDGVPSIFTPVAFLNIFENELRNLIHVVESVRYGLPPETTLEYLLVT